MCHFDYLEDKSVDLMRYPLEDRYKYIKYTIMLVGT